MLTRHTVSNVPGYVAVMLKYGIVDRDHTKTLEMSTAWELFKRIVEDAEVSKALFTFRDRERPRGHGGVFSVVAEVDAVLKRFSEEKLLRVRARLSSNPA